MSHRDIEEGSSFMKDVGEMKLLVFWINAHSVYLINLSRISACGTNFDIEERRFSGSS